MYSIVQGITSIDCEQINRRQLTVNKLTGSDFVTNFVAVISSLSEGLGKMALDIAKIYLGLPFSANRRCSRSVCSRSVASRSVCRGQLSWNHCAVFIAL